MAKKSRRPSRNELARWIGKAVRAIRPAAAGAGVALPTLWALNNTKGADLTTRLTNVAYENLALNPTNGQFDEARFMRNLAVWGGTLVFLIITGQVSKRIR